MTVYAPTARFDTGRALTEAELFKLAPSVFATTAHESRSERFKPIPTIEILRGLQAEGFSVVGAKQSTARDVTKAAHTKHLLRLRRLDDDQKHQVGGTVAEMILKNANDGSSAYDLMAGLFRIQCLNSMVTQTATIGTVKVRHSGEVQAKVIEGTFRVIGEAQKALAAPELWQQIRLDRDEARVMAEAAHVIRFGDSEGNVTTPIRPEQLLTPRRAEDTAPNLWVIGNVLQENIIRGGIHGVGRDANNRPRNVTTRAINGVDQDVRLNKALWVLNERMAELKGYRAAA